MRRFSAVLFGAIILSSSSIAFSQQRESRPSQDDAEVYLRAKAQEFSASESAAKQLGVSVHGNAIYNLIRDKGRLPADKLRGRDQAQKGQIRDALIRTVAYYLASVGLTPNDITRLEKSGLDPLASGTRLVTGTPTIDDGLTISPVVMEAKVTANNAVAGSATREVFFTGTAALKGDLISELSIRLPSPAPVSDAQAGETYLLFLSKERSAFQRAANRDSGAEAVFVALPYKKVGESYEPVSPDQGGTTSSVGSVQAFMSRFPSQPSNNR